MKLNEKKYFNTIVCNICKSKFTMVNIQPKSIIYICVKCTFPEIKTKKK